MKNTLVYISILLLSLSCNSKKKDVLFQLNSVVGAIDSMPAYTYTSILTMHHEGMSFSDTMAAYIQKSNDSVLLPVKYVFENKMGDMQFFDGSEFNNLIKSERSIIRNTTPQGYEISSNQGLLFSPFYIRNYISYLIENDTAAVRFIGDSLLANGGRRYYEFTSDYMYLLDGSIIRNGDLLPNQMKAEGINKRHVLTIDTASDLPIGFREINADGSYTEVSFLNLRESKQSYDSRAEILAKDEFLTLGLDEYMQIQMVKQNELLNTQAPPFVLPAYPSGEVSLSELKGSPVLLEFWFPGCAYCIKSVPEVNEIFNNFGSKGLKVFAVEFSDANQDRITKYVEKYKVKYPIVTEGKDISLAYGVNSGPTFILLDKEHKVRYRSGNGLNYAELTKEIEAAL